MTDVHQICRSALSFLCLTALYSPLLQKQKGIQPTEQMKTASVPSSSA